VITKKYKVIITPDTAADADISDDFKELKK
jgi:hypothetical protein